MYCNTVADSTLPADYANSRGACLLHHYPLNEDNGNAHSEAYNLASCTESQRYALTPDKPFDGRLGYMSVAVERAGACSMLAEARALAHGTPVNPAYLESSSFSRGFPALVRRFNQALLSLPALTLAGVSTNPAVVVRKSVSEQGSDYAAINTGLDPALAVNVDFGAGRTAVVDLLSGKTHRARKLQFDLYPGEVRTFRL